MSNDLQHLISQISKLNINKRNLVTELVNELAESNQGATTRREVRGSLVAPNVGVRTHPRWPNHNFISKYGVPLAVGDRVEIQTTRKVGREGDIAEVDQFNRQYVAVTLLESGKSTQRTSKYLKFIEWVVHHECKQRNRRWSWDE